MIERYLAQNVTIICIRLADVENVVSEAASWERGYGVATVAIAFILVKR